MEWMFPLWVCFWDQYSLFSSVKLGKLVTLTHHIWLSLILNNLKAGHKTNGSNIFTKLFQDTLKKRAERFGQNNSNTLKKLELDEKIKKRQERFGEIKKENEGPAAKKVKVEVNKSLIEPKVDPVVDDKMKKRAERFSAAAAVQSSWIRG